MCLLLLKSEMTLIENVGLLWLVPKKKHSPKMPVVVVHEEAHLSLADNSAPKQIHTESAVPIIGHQDGQVL